MRCDEDDVLRIRNRWCRATLSLLAIFLKPRGLYDLENG